MRAMRGGRREDDMKKVVGGEGEMRSTASPALSLRMG